MEKLKIIIADDELIIREGLSEFIKKECPQLSLVGVYKNGIQVIEHLKKEHVDIIITDISMPLKNGIDILQFLYDTKTDTKTIVFTGYRDFEYAHKAINLGAFYLLTKPLDLKQLLDTISNAEKSIASGHGKFIDEAENNPDRIELFRSELKLMFSGISEINFNNSHIKYCTDMPFARCAVYSVDIEKSNQNNSLINWLMLEENVDGNYSSFCIENRLTFAKYIIFIYESNPTASLDKFEKRLLRNLKIHKIVGFKKSSHCFDNFEAACINNFEKNAVKYLDCIAENKNTAKAEYLNALKSSYNDCMCRYFVKAFLLKSRQQYDIETEALEKLIPKGCKKEECFNVLSKAEEEIIGKLSDNDDLIVRIKNYMYNHCEGDFSLKSISDKFEISPAYLSRIFKKKTGANFNKFAMEVKMTRAQELLRDESLSMAEVIESLGYTGNDYFVRVFRSYFGMTPREYRHKRGIHNE